MDKAENEPYQPTSEDYKKAGEMMSDEEKEDSKRLARINKVVNEGDYSFVEFNQTSTAPWLSKLKEFEGSEFWEEVKKYLEGEEVIDLGCGSGACWPIMFAESCGAKKYTGVEKYRPPSKQFMGLEIESGKRLFGIENLEIDWGYEKQDMLIYLSKMPDNSANIIISGIDSFIIDPYERKDYYELLLSEAVRVAGKDHIILSHMSMPMPDCLRRSGAETKVYSPTGEEEGEYGDSQDSFCTIIKAGDATPESIRQTLDDIPF